MKLKWVKKAMSVLLAAMMVFSLTACSSSSSDSSSDEEETEEAEEEEEEEEEEADSSDSDSDSDDCPEVTSTETIEIVWSHNAAESSVQHLMALKFKEEVEERSNGYVTVTIYPNGELGTVSENDQALREGTIQVMSGTSGGLADDTLAYFDLPCMVTSNEEFEELFGRGTELREITEERYNDMNMVCLALEPAGFGIISSNVEVTCYEDLEGLNIRTSENSIQMEMFSDWGCNPTPVSFSELYIALQQGLVDAQNNTLDTTVSSGLQEQQKYIIETKHSVMALGFYMNLDFYNSLPDDVREMIDWVCENIMDDYIVEEAEAAEEAAMETVLEEGLEVIEFTDEDRAKMLEAAEPVYEMVAELAGEEVVELIQSQISD